MDETIDALRIYEYVIDNRVRAEDILGIESLLQDRNYDFFLEINYSNEGRIEGSIVTVGKALDSKTLDGIRTIRGGKLRDCEMYSVRLGRIRNITDGEEVKRCIAVAREYSKNKELKGDK